MDSFTMYPRTWINCDSSMLSSSGSEADIDTESGISMSSSRASSFCGSLDDIISVTSKDSSHGGKAKFGIATYNILTDLCIREGDYLYCPTEIRYMKSRNVAILAEIKTMSSDVVCFQEVDRDTYQRYIETGMNALGYVGVLHERLDNQGLAVFWREKAFELLQQKHCVLHHLAETYLQMTDMSITMRAAVRRAIERPEAALLLRLRHISSGTQIAIANMHVTWSQLKFPALQALQISVAINELADFSRGISRCAQIICGDFNSPPTSIPYKLMSTGQIPQDDVDELKNNCEFVEMADLLRAVDLFAMIPSAFILKTFLKSAYKTTMNTEPQLTNCDEAGQDYRSQLCLDYIWYCSDSLDVTGVLETPPTDVIVRHQALPSVDFPSDHLPLMAEFVFK